MRDLLTFFWTGIPPKSTFQQRDKNWHPTPQSRLAMATWKAILERHVPAAPLSGFLGIRLAITWPHTRESARRKGGLPVRKATRPDGVNILKGVEDIMTRLGYFADDNILSVETVERWHGDIPGVMVQITEFED